MSYGGLTCEFCGGQHPVMWLITNLANGETLNTCADDFPVTLIPLLAAQLGVNPDKFYDTVKRFVDREAKAEAKAAAEAPSSRPFAEGFQPAAPVVDDEGQADDDPEADPASMTNAEYYGSDTS